MGIDLSKYEGHTPGPWEYYWRVDDENHADCGVYALRRPGQAYAVARCPKYQSKIQWNADAILIAAAPELLAEVGRLRAEPSEALIKLRALVDGLDATYWSSWQSTGHFSDALEAAREFLAKHGGSK